MNNTINIKVDFSNSKSVKVAINKYKDLDYAVFGSNTDGDDIEISFSEEGAVVKTYQSNGWLRVNYYDVNGYMADETFEGRWR